MTPRSSGWFESGFFGQTAVIVALLMGGLALTVGPSSEASETEILRERGEVATGTVLESSIVERRIRRAISRRIEEEIRFHDEFGIPYEVRLIDCTDRGLDPVGAKVDVLYDPEDPEEHARFADLACPNANVSNALPFTIGGVIVLALGFVLWFLAWQGARWRWIGAAIAILVIAGIATAASFDPSCECQGLAWTSAPMATLGGIAIVGRIAQRRRSTPGPPQEPIGS